MESQCDQKAVRNGWLGQSSTGEIYSRIFVLTNVVKLHPEHQVTQVTCIT